MMEDLTFSCPVCGAEVSRRAKACPECGACEKSGWSEDQYLDGIDLPDEGYSYDAPAGNRLGDGGARKSKVLWVVVGIVVVLAMALLAASGLWR